MNGHILITPEVATILEQCTCTDLSLSLPPVQFDRKLYVSVNQILEALGGKWNRKAKTHLFTYPPQQALDEALSSGYAINQKKAFNWFETPYPVVQQMIEAAHLHATHHTLEPSCGNGAIVGELLKYMPSVDVCEVNEGAMSRMLERFGIQKVRCVGGDFLLFSPQAKYDRIVANPPFSQQQDVSHAMHMLDLLRPRGRLVSVMSAGMRYRDNRPVRELKAKLCDMAEWDIEDLPEQAFKSSGTMVRTVLLTAERR